MIHSFLQSGSARFEQLAGPELAIAVREIDSKFQPDWKKNDVAERTRATVVEPFQRAMAAHGQPRLLRSFSIGEKKEDLELVGPGHNKAEEQLHFLELGEQVFVVASYQRDHDRTELRLYPPLPRRGVPTLEALKERGFQGLYGQDRGDVEVVRLFRERGPRTDVQFGKGKRYEDQNFAWALYESLTSALRRGDRSAASLGPELIKAQRIHEFVDARLREGRPVNFSLLLPYLAHAKGQLLPDGPPGGQVLLHALEWNGKTVAVTQELGPKPRIRAFLRDQIGEQPTWLELRFPAQAEVPARGVSALIQGDRLRLFGGVDRANNGLATEWTFALEQGARNAYLDSTFQPGPGLDGPRAFATAIAPDRVALLGGVAGFYAGRGKAEAEAPAWQRRWSEQAKGQAGWRDAGALPDRMSGGGSTFATADGAFVGPGAGLDGRLCYLDFKNRVAIELPELPGRLGLGQLHLDDSVLYYSGGYGLRGDGASAEKIVYGLDLNQLDGWKKIGDCELLAGSNRLVHRGGRPMILGLSPQGRFTFVPGGAP